MVGTLHGVTLPPLGSPCETESQRDALVAMHNRQWIVAEYNRRGQWITQHNFIMHGEPCNFRPAAVQPENWHKLALSPNFTA